MFRRDASAPPTRFGRRTLLAAAGGIAGALASEGARAQGTYPARPVRVVVTYPPGGGADTVARIIFARLSERTGQHFVVENRSGATGTIGAAAVARAVPDGYTLMHDATAFSINPAVYQQLPYDAHRDFEPIFLAVTVPLLLVVTPSVPVRTVAELIAFAKDARADPSFGSPGNGTVQHLALEMLKSTAGVRFNHVPYRGGGPALNDLIAGQIQFLFDNAASAIGHVRSGTIRAIAQTTAGRIASLPDLPAMAETLPGFEANEWNGIFAPAGTPPDIVRRLNAELNAAVAEPAVAERLAGLAAATRPNTPAEFRAFVEAAMDKYGRLAREANIRIE
jgi:tripartite-type tricarboxylate transporter receptor subunit TctC